MKKYSVGVDFGTLSARAVLADTETGEIVAQSVFEYPHGVMDSVLPNGKTVEKNSAYQHPHDYIDALSFTVKDVIEKSAVDSSQICGIGIDFTSCTVLPLDENSMPMCFLKEFEDECHAYVKLWKHHSAQKEADEFTEKAIENGEKWLENYGGKVSSEWLFPKITETLRKSPELYKKTAYFAEAGDWLSGLLCGSEVRSSCMAGYKGMWSKKDGYPSKEFLGKIEPELSSIVGSKISENIKPTGTLAGRINSYGAVLTGLKEGTAVSVPIIDAHAALISAGIVKGGELMIIIGTSSCHIILDKEEKNVKGICGVVRDGIIPSYAAYEGGQACVGDTFDWFVNNYLPSSYAEEAKKEGKSKFAYIKEKAAKLSAGESHLLALDWWNGNRTPLADYDLTGAIFGFTLKTKPEEIYRALIEATAYGTKAITELYTESGVAVEKIYATGGISMKDELLMQIYADVLGKEICVPQSSQAGALGSAIYAACAGGAFDSFETAAEKMAIKTVKRYTPIKENTAIYEKLYKSYKELTDYFGRGGNGILKSL